MLGYHYSSEKLKIGETIISHQHKSQTYSLVWNIFNQYKPIPKEFGYAYPYERENRISKYLYLVETDNFLRGNFNHSIYKSMDALSSQPFANKNIPLKERLKMREVWLYNEANNYFSHLYDEKQIELISENWIVKEILK